MAVSTVRKPKPKRVVVIEDTVPVLPEPTHKNGNGNGHGFDYLIKAKETLKPKRRNRFAIIFTRAADALVKHGWARNTLVDGNGAMCLVGGINFAINGDPDEGVGNGGALKALRPFLPRQYGDNNTDHNNYLAATEFNDTDGTKRRVINLLRRAATALDK